jgi:hypothetical protein
MGEIFNMVYRKLIGFYWTVVTFIFGKGNYYWLDTDRVVAANIKLSNPTNDTLPNMSSL